ncbi:MAG TPA: hypothetical protein P5273_11185 [Syntrophomonadaceae bacterium]|jgi:polyhydroxyalkanoic acid synthase PhaR subunit|nr:hypothetical protein [Syntrophomonadaceae bacterium]
MSMNSNDKEKIHMPDFAELWKEMYFKTETAWADAFKELISTQTFVGIINKALEQNLSNENVTRQMVDKYMEISPVPSKKDIARVAELVISLEEKIDQLEYQFSQTMGKMADSLIKMADHQASLKEELHSLQQSLTKVEKKLETVNKKVNAPKKEKSAAKEKPTSKKKEAPAPPES